jgi:hypothetical protein
MRNTPLPSYSAPPPFHDEPVETAELLIKEGYPLPLTLITDLEAMGFLIEEFILDVLAEEYSSGGFHLV